MSSGKKKSLISISSLSDKTLDKIIDLGFKVKKSPKKFVCTLEGKNFGLIFEKPSTRTRVSFEVGISQLGGSSFYLSPDTIQPGTREPLKDIARTLSRYLDALILRTYKHEFILEINSFCSVPVINGLSDFSHPCQALADYMTIRENCGQRKKITVAYLGDGNNVLNSLMIILTRKGVNLHIATPAPYGPNENVVKKARAHAAASGSELVITEKPSAAVKDADVIYTDVWVSMGEEESGKKEEAFLPYQVNSALINKAKKDPLVMHCLPAHRGKEITDEVIESERSIVFDQAENRLHVQKAALIHLLT